MSNTATATATACDLTILMDLENPDREPTTAPVTGALRAAMAGAEQNPTNDAVPDADGCMAAWGTATALERRRCSSSSSVSASASAASPKFEARFFFTKHASQRTGVVLLGNVTVHDRGASALRAEAHKLIVGDPSGEALKMVETHMVVVDVGLHKDSGGLGASHPQETLILYKPDHHG